MGLETHELRFAIMGSFGHVVVVGSRAAELAAQARERLEALEGRWSRFIPTSDISRLNSADGMPCVVSTDTVLLVESMLEAWRATSGRFDPTVHDAIRQLGYRASFATMSDPVYLGSPQPAPGCVGIDVDRELGMVQLPPNVRLDAGGIGKGLAADLVATEMIGAGAEGLLVNVGGDVRVVGTPPEGDAWKLDVAHPNVDEPRVAQIMLSDGGVATSTSKRRQWTTTDRQTIHHLIDPRQGTPAEVDRVQVTAVAGTAWWAEVVAKVVFLDGALPAERTSALVFDSQMAPTILGDPRWFMFDRERERVSR